MYLLPSTNWKIFVLAFNQLYKESSSWGTSHNFLPFTMSLPHLLLSTPSPFPHSSRYGSLPLHWLYSGCSQWLTNFLFIAKSKRRLNPHFTDFLTVLVTPDPSSLGLSDYMVLDSLNFLGTFLSPLTYSPFFAHPLNVGTHHGSLLGSLPLFKPSLWAISLSPWLQLPSVCWWSSNLCRESRSSSLASEPHIQMLTGHHSWIARGNPSGVPPSPF